MFYPVPRCRRRNGLIYVQFCNHLFILATKADLIIELYLRSNNHIFLVDFKNMCEEIV